MEQDLPLTDEYKEEDSFNMAIRDEGKEGFKWSEHGRLRWGGYSNIRKDKGGARA